MAEFLRRPRWTPELIHTGQHSSPEMSDQFFCDLEIPHPNVHLGLSGGTPTYQTAQILLKLEPVLAQVLPDLLLVVGDVTSTLAAALAAVRNGIRVAHVEAGLRSFDPSMPEEINRVVTDHLSDFLFTTEPSGERNLRAEGIDPSRIFFVGNVMIDTLLRFRAKAAQSGVLQELGLEAGNYAVVTLHRPANVDDPGRLAALLAMLQEVATRIPVVFPVHPRTQKQLEEQKVSTDGLVLCPPKGYLDFLRLMSEARLVLTDSGGIQEETTILQVPCLTMRTNTERPVTIDQGSNCLVGIEPEAILSAALQELANARLASPKTPELWDGNASGRICDILEAKL